MARETLVTQEGYDKLQEELEHLINVRRLEVAERIKTAREYGDISENAEYDDAKNEQARLESRILQLEERIRHAKVVSEEDVDTKVAGIGTKVSVVDQKTKEKIVYTIVGSTEADPMNNRVSNESPIGKALMGHKRNDVVEVSVPSGKIKYEIKSIRVA